MKQTIPVILAALLLSSICVHGEETDSAWDETGMIHIFRRPVPTAVNIYTRANGEDILHRKGVIEGVAYDLLTVTPSENTFLQVDYQETPVFLNQLVDSTRLEQGFQRAGGINGGYFSNTESEYGRPVGAVRKNGTWQLWGEEELTPAYGNGYATAYFDASEMKLLYHGWFQGQWCGDNLWDYEGYHIGYANALTGSYTWFADGIQQDITSASKPSVDYRTYGRALTILGQNHEGDHLLLTIWGTVPEDSVISLLTGLDVSDAIRLDGGGSTQMIYESDLVCEEEPAIGASKASRPIGTVTIGNCRLKVHSAPQEEASISGDATFYEQHYVYSRIAEGERAWYRIGINRWIEATAEEAVYESLGEPSFIPQEN